ncbi:MULTISPECIES: flagellar biosynthesis anti-sigma factor FlgM [Legionella]|uniref:Negative regulator of flagellin synthesis n=1 Tax=Legionella septentrionalis TaxID=2498109 RepID=A0A433JJH7_9GAMM|nr:MULTISPECIES: flagellar biosynthesis anti-sigma factor FlgM [Legionella]MCP0913332.1 flagellar biosynthesis anti-sigma factor FlgM [Legionella sp. 27cVA30]RUQ88376.1 flagellar biosynthesis anti-sigma factor FlgM [Legionella septentrionalis]RUQ93516.1 flagellar biosynthesis anti-sigma factor FlgM [Legionella septentrionalis]RUR09482.1 flagellar biosynthesis anti-sigma factor FlgM [Legionella septentrionalis]RUR13251.1 flagellar biosynthesis anti-sigma factor FlgM [Legionella septentrionalis]
MVNKTDKPGSLNFLQDKDNAVPQEFLNSLDFDASAKQLDALKALIFHDAGTNQAKIQKIKQDLLSGSYQIQSQKIASKLMEYQVFTEAETA